jgi:hypothetical protein
VLARNGIVDWTDRALAYDRYLDERLDLGWPRWLETMSEVFCSTDRSDLKLKIRLLPSR